MTETGALVGIYGAVDQVAQSDPELRAAISQLLPLYRDPDLHWYEDFQTWLKGTRAELGGSEAELGGSEAEDLEGPSPSLAGALQDSPGSSRAVACARVGYSRSPWRCGPSPKCANPTPNWEAWRWRPCT